MSDGSTNSPLVLVTGVSGYVGSQCAAELLRQGYRVRGTLRNLSKADAVRSAIAAEAPNADTIEFVTADLLSDDGWFDAVSGCTYVLHVASPFFMTEPDHEDDMIRPAVDGTRRVLNAAKQAGVTRTIVTSSIVAMGAHLKTGTIDDTSWSDTDQIGAYAKSKTLAEQAVWEFHRSQGEPTMEIATINPGGVMGPTLTGDTTGASVGMAHQMIEGKIPMVPDISLAMVDVRDVASAHVAALTADGVDGNRYIVASDEPVAFMKMAETLKAAGYSKASTRKAPTPLMKLMALFNKEAKGMVGFIGRKVGCDTTPARKVLGFNPIAFDTTVKDMAASIA